MRLATGACWPVYKGFRRVTNPPQVANLPHICGTCRAEYQGGFSTLLGWAFRPRNPMKNRAGTRMGRGFVGQLDKLRPIGNRPTAALARDSGGNQPPRWPALTCGANALIIRFSRPRW